MMAAATIIQNSKYVLKLSDNFPADAAFASALQEKLQLGQRSNFEKLNSSSNAGVYKFKTYFKGKTYSLIIKQYFLRNAADFIKRIFVSRAVKAFDAADILSANGFLTPAVAAIGKSRWPFSGCDFLITAEIENSNSFASLIEGSISRQKKKALISQFGRTIGFLHRKNIFHGDLRLGNILVKEAADDNFSFYFLDNERTKKFSTLPYRLRIKNLVQANMVGKHISYTDKARFFSNYMKQQKNIDRKKIVSDVTTKTRKRFASKGLL